MGEPFTTSPERVHAQDTVVVRREPLALATYEPAEPSRFPAFLGNRVYQGSSGSVYPLPFHERIAAEPTEHVWDAVHLANRWIELTVLPELGGRIDCATDRATGYDFFYRNEVIKPALVGLAGPWISGGVEFNWPQHHRPATYQPTEAHIEHGDEGSVTVWCSDHDPFARMKGMHGIRLHPDRAVIEVVVRLHNRTALPQTFLWWANVAARAHADYQSFFPPDVTYVADHANRATVSFPAATGTYYGVDYPERRAAQLARGQEPGEPDADRLDWYRNIPVPTSYMVLQTRDGFFGGYDHGVGAGFVHWADPAISPGKKLWTWGDAPFGHAWDRNLTDDGSHYVELMAGVYTNNQPDFTYLAPGETKTFSQFWYPYAGLGTIQAATREAALALRVEDGVLTVGAAVTRRRDGLRLTLTRADGAARQWTLDLAAGESFRDSVAIEGPDAWGGAEAWGGAGAGRGVEGMRLTLRAADGSVLAEYRAEPPAGLPVPPPAREPDPPELIDSVDQLYLTGVHLAQYRHATRSPETWWRAALERDPDDSRCNTAMGERRLRQGRYDEAEEHLTRAVARLTALNLNPRDGEAHYLLGLTLLRRAALAEPAGPQVDDGLPEVADPAARAELERLARDADAHRAQDAATDAAAPGGAARRERHPSASGDERTDEHAADLRIRARAALGRAAWDHRWFAAAHLALARDDAAHGDDAAALDHLRQVLRAEPEHLAARCATVALLRRAGTSADAAEADALLADTLALDPLDVWARHLRDGAVPSDAQHHLDLAREYAAIGALDEALAVLDDAETAPQPAGGTRVGPLLAYARAAYLARAGRGEESHAARRDAAARDATWCLPVTLDDVDALTWAIAADDAETPDARARALLGSWCYVQGRVDEARALWSRATQIDPGDAATLRNLGLLAYNHDADADRAWACYLAAAEHAPDDAQLLHEIDELAQRRGEGVDARLARLESHRDLVDQRDDLTVSLATLLTAAGRADDALALLGARRFQPWEGGEGRVLAAWEDARLAAAQAALSTSGTGATSGTTHGRVTDTGAGSHARPDPAAAVAHARAALDPPATLGEARHPLANRARVLLALGDALAARAGRGDDEEAARAWEAAAAESGDFQDMAATPASELTYSSALAARRLGDTARAEHLTGALRRYADTVAATPPRVDYFATSLPQTLLFSEDPQDARDRDVALLRAQLDLLDGRCAATDLAALLRARPDHVAAMLLLRAHDDEHQCQSSTT